MALKRAIRPFIPDGLMARYRLRQHSRFCRVNVDVFTDRASARGWLAATPDTYRVKLTTPASAAHDAVTLPGEGPLADAASVLLGDVEIDVGVVAEAPVPGLVDRRRTEPSISPMAIAAARHVIDDIGGMPSGEGALAVLLSRLRAAGYRIGLRPEPATGRRPGRSDPINEDVVVILSAVPIHDIGGGSRSAQIACELLRRGMHVIYVSLHPAQESIDLGLRFLHPELEQYDAPEFDTASVTDRAARPGFLIAALPHRWCLDTAGDLGSRGWTVVYDMIDDWSDPSLGGDWYQRDIEHRLAATAHLVTASAQDLVDRAIGLGSDAVLLPNAVNELVFTGAVMDRPADLPEGAVIGYHGSLYGDWFDWESLAAVAAANPDATVVVIGDLKAPRPGLPGNIRFLGLKPQADLPAYLAHFDVGLVPFTVTGTTHAVSPLKVYEYLASGVPVASPPLRALRGLNGVYVADRLADAVADARAAGRPDGDRARAEHSWRVRIDELFDRLGWERRQGDASPVRVVTRPVVHYAKSERLVQ